jgi:hypothetical protein
MQFSKVMNANLYIANGGRLRIVANKLRWEFGYIRVPHPSYFVVPVQAKWK